MGLNYWRTGQITWSVSHKEIMMCVEIIQKLSSFSEAPHLRWEMFLGFNWQKQRPPCDCHDFSSFPRRKCLRIKQFCEKILVISIFLHHTAELFEEELLPPHIASIFSKPPLPPLPAETLSAESYKDFPQFLLFFSGFIVFESELFLTLFGQWHINWWT